jgi:hypothetical protein
MPLEASSEQDIYIQENQNEYNKTIIQPAVLFGSETWILTEKSTATLMSWERKVLRRIYDPVSINDTWRIRSNRELENLYNGPDILAETKCRRIEWLGHVLRLESSRVPQKILGGRHETGRPRLRWLDDVANDLRNMGARQWRKKAEDRRESEGVVREAKVKLKKDSVEKKEEVLTLQSLLRSVLRSASSVRFSN